MTYQDFISAFEKQAYHLSSEKQEVLALAIAKKLFPDYQTFYYTHHWGNPDLLLDAISLFEQPRSNGIDVTKISGILLDLDAISPDMDDYGDSIGSNALNACAAIMEALQFLLDKDPIHILNIGAYYTDTTYFKIQDGKELTEEQIDNHPEMMEARTYLIRETADHTP